MIPWTISAWTRSRGIGAATLAGLSCVVAGAAVPAQADLAAGTTSRASISTAGRQGDRDSNFAVISGRGRYVAFQSDATNLVPGDTNGLSDVFVRDRLAGTTRRVSVGPGGRQANGESGNLPAISADGRFVAFGSFATNLITRDTNNVGDVFVRDQFAGVTRRVSVGPGGRQVHSPNDATGSFGAAISANGRFVAFSSWAVDLVPGDTNNSPDAFVRDLLGKVTRRVSVGPGGQQANGFSHVGGVSGDGRFVTFQSDAPNLVPGDTNGIADIFVRDLLTGTTRRVSVGPKGRQSNGEGSSSPDISAGGRFVVFVSTADNLVSGDVNGTADVFVRDRVAERTRLVSVGVNGQQGDGGSDLPAISANGRFVAFQSFAENLVPEDANGACDVFVRDLLAQTTVRVSMSARVQPDGCSDVPSVSADGRHVSFRSFASNLVPSDTNGAADIFVRDAFGDTQPAR